MTILIKIGVNFFPAIMVEKKKINNALIISCGKLVVYLSKREKRMISFLKLLLRFKYKSFT